VSAEMGACSVCGQTKRLSPKGNVYTHPNPEVGGECEGSRKPEAPLVPEDVVLAAVEEFRASLRVKRRKGFWGRLWDRLRGRRDVLDD
jgi:hypothetical protein